MMYKVINFVITLQFESKFNGIYAYTKATTRE